MPPKAFNMSMAKVRDRLRCSYGLQKQPPFSARKTPIGGDPTPFRFLPKKLGLNRLIPGDTHAHVAPPPSAVRFGFQLPMLAIPAILAICNPLPSSFIPGHPNSEVWFFNFQFWQSRRFWQFVVPSPSHSSQVIPIARFGFSITNVGHSGDSGNLWSPPLLIHPRSSQ